MSGNTIDGCLGGSVGNFTLVDKSGTTYQLVLPQGANANALTPHVGEEVRVAGAINGAGASAGMGANAGAGATAGTGASASGTTGSASSAGGSGSSAGASAHSINVTKIAKVADKCSGAAATPTTK
jgi:hypothetical protein